MSSCRVTPKGIPEKLVHLSCTSRKEDTPQLEGIHHRGRMITKFISVYIFLATGRFFRDKKFITCKRKILVESIGFIISKQG